MQSPITKFDKSVLIQEFAVEKIIKKYQEELTMDVTRFFKGLASIKLYECVDTGYKFYYPFNVSGDGSFYSELNTRHAGYYIEKRWEHVQALKVIVKDMNVLEIGSGDGHFLKLLKQKGVNASGLELNKDAVSYCNNNGLNVTCELIEEHAKHHIGEYDAVCFFQVLEHITDVRSFLEAALITLRKGGILIIGVPNNNPYLFKHDMWHTLNLPAHHAGLWSKRAFINLAKFFNLKVAGIQIEPLSEYKTWFAVQIKNYKNRNKFLGGLLAKIPRQIYKPVLKMFRKRIEGRNVLGLFVKL